MLSKGVTDPMVLACGGILGVTFGSFAAGVFLLIRFLTERDLGRNTADAKASYSGSSIAKTTLALAIPISLSSAVMSLTSTLDMFFVKGSLAAYGLTAQQVTEQYGSYAGATWSLFNLPPTLTVTVGIAVLPFLTTALAKKNYEEAATNMRSSAKVVAIIAMPCALGMSAMAEPIIKLLYNQSYWAVAIPTLQALAISIFFVAFVSLTSVFLQAAGKVNISLLTMGIGGALKLIINVVAVSLIGIMGAPLGTFACYGSIAILNIIFIRKFVGFKLPIRATILKPMLCAALCSGGAWGIWAVLHKVAKVSSNLSLIVALAAAVAIYVCALLLFKVLAKEDMVFIPKGAKIGAFLAKHGWIHE
jgi:stage V sporulation protein B